MSEQMFHFILCVICAFFFGYRTAKILDPSCKTDSPKLKTNSSLDGISGSDGIPRPDGYKPKSTCEPPVISIDKDGRKIITEHCP